MRHRAEQGTTIVELMMAMVVLAIGLGAITTLLVTAIASNNRNSRDTTATLLAQMVIEQLSGQHVYSVATISVTDCAGISWNMANTPGAVGTGNGASLAANGNIDFTQAVAAIPAGYQMYYVDCSTAGGLQTTYDVRWNVMSVSTNTSTRMITAAARQTASNANHLGGLFVAFPVNLRGIGAPAAGL